MQINRPRSDRQQSIFWSTFLATPQLHGLCEGFFDECLKRVHLDHRQHCLGLRGLFCLAGVNLFFHNVARYFYPVNNHLNIDLDAKNLAQTASSSTQSVPLQLENQSGFSDVIFVNATRITRNLLLATIFAGLSLLALRFSVLSKPS